MSRKISESHSWNETDKQSSVFQILLLYHGTINGIDIAYVWVVCEAVIKNIIPLIWDPAWFLNIEEKSIGRANTKIYRWSWSLLLFIRFCKLRVMRGGGGEDGGSVKYLIFKI